MTLGGWPLTRPAARGFGSAEEGTWSLQWALTPAVV